jgi:hypothetical protein
VAPGSPCGGQLEGADKSREPGQAPSRPIDVCVPVISAGYRPATPWRRRCGIRSGPSRCGPGACAGAGTICARRQACRCPGFAASLQVRRVIRTPERPWQVPPGCLARVVHLVLAAPGELEGCSFTAPELAICLTQSASRTHLPTARIRRSVQPGARKALLRLVNQKLERKIAAIARAFAHLNLLPTGLWLVLIQTGQDVSDCVDEPYLQGFDALAVLPGRCQAAGAGWQRLRGVAGAFTIPLCCRDARLRANCCANSIDAQEPWRGAP